MRFAANTVRLRLRPLACNLVTFLGILATPEEIETWSLTSLRERQIRTGVRLVRNAIFRMAEDALLRIVVAGVLALIDGLLDRRPRLFVHERDRGRIHPHAGPVIGEA